MSCPRCNAFKAIKTRMLERSNTAFGTTQDRINNALSIHTDVQAAMKLNHTCGAIGLDLFRAQ